ncbi:MAG: DUF58 domain-containing protein [Microbacterium sp.]|uniref:DUF58 domain-containing protein n=1 Tax=Microbacterium sp. TaxID=51671 RepID=UPI0039E556E7
MTTAPEQLLHRLEWTVVRRLDGLLQGAHRTVFRGAGLDLAGISPYSADDDVRHIDWNTTARTGEPHVRRFLEERELTAWFVIDRSASMRVGAREAPNLLTDVALSLARLFTLSGDRVGAILYDDDRQVVIPPSTGRSPVLRLAREIGAGRENGPDRRNERRGLFRRLVGATEQGRQTDIARMLGLAASTIGRRSLVIVVSDFIGRPGWERQLARLAHRNDVSAVRLTASASKLLPEWGTTIVEDAETGEQLLVDASDPAFRRRLAELDEASERALGDALRRAGVADLTVSADDDLALALVGVARRTARRSA